MFRSLLPCGLTSLLLGWIAVPIASAAPPKLDYLFPAGAQRGATVEVTAGGVFERWPVKAWCDSKDIAVKPAKVSGKLTITVGKDVVPGAYAIRLYDEQGASIARPFFVGTLPELLEKEPNDDPRKPHALDTSSVVINGRLDKPGDVDTFALKLTKGQTLVASLEAFQTLRSPMDGVLQILSADGFVLEQNDDYHALDPQIAFTAPRDGTYLVRLFAFPSVPDSSIRFAGKENFVYRLTLTTGPYVEYAYPLAVTRSAPTSVDLVGWNLPDNLRKFNVVPQDGSTTLRLYDPRIGNPFSVRLDPNPTLAKVKATLAEPMVITPPVTITGRLDRPGDFDVFQLDAKKGQKLAVRIEARTLGFPLDPVLRITDAAGKMLAQTKPAALNADPLLDYTPTGDGKYRLEVRDLHSAGGPRHVYRLHVGPIASDFEVKIVGDNFTLTPGKSLEIPVTVTRTGGYKPEVSLHVEGLPKTVGVMTTGKGITLTPPVGEAAFSGPIRILGTSKDGSVRAGQAPVVELGRPTENAWLTIVAAKK